MDLMTLLPFFLILAAVGAVAGVIAGLLGVGGGMVLVPAFYYIFAALGHDGPQLMQLCVGTSLATILATSTRSLRAHAARGAVDRDFLRGWAPAIAIGAGAGALLASSLKSDTLTAVFAVLAALAGLWMLLGRKDLRLADHLPDGPRAWGMGGALGLASAVMGIGGGTFGVPLMTLHGMAIHRAVGTASGLGLIIAAPATLGFLFTRVENPPPLSIGAVNLPAFALVVAMTLLTTPLGVRLAHGMNPAPLKRAFALFLIAVAANMGRKALGW